MIRIATSLAIALVLAGCSGSGRLHNFDTGFRTPDDFAVLPAHPLTIPDTSSLPEPGGVNLADPDPPGEAVALLGGSDGAGSAGDAALMTRVARYGVDPGIRALLAQEDAEWRRRAARTGGPNIMGRDRYFPAYARMALDPQAELARFRAAGVATPSAPPR